MKKLLFFGLASLSFGCSHVSHDELQRELRRTRAEVQQEMNNGDVAALECAYTLGFYQRAALFCDGLRAYCNAVQVYEHHCLRHDEQDNLMPALPGVGPALQRAIDEFNTAARQLQQNGSGETEETPNEDSVTPDEETQQDFN